MLKLLLTLAVVVVALMMWFGKGRARGTPLKRTGRPSTQVPVPQPMVTCARCGVHLPQAEAFVDDSGRRYCGADHRRLGPTGGSNR